MGNSASAPEKVYNAARNNDVAALQSLLREFHRQGLGSLAQHKILEHQDERQWTPLLIAAAKGYHDCAELLVRNGANVHHVSSRPDGTTALHECVARGHERIADLLLHYGASPFLENGRGLTAVDVAINCRNVALVRKLEMRSPFQAMLLMKVQKWGGLGTEWKHRWVVVMPRYPSPAAPPGTERLVRMLLVAFKGRDQCVPVCKVWLDGAVARAVLGYKGSAAMQCALVLHTLHAAPAGAHITGDQKTGYTLHFRQADDQQASGAVLRRFIDIVNRRDGAPNGQASTSQGQVAGFPEPVKPTRLPEPAIAPVTGESDEQLARRLQELYNKESGISPAAAPRPGVGQQSRPANVNPTPGPPQPPQMGPGPLQSSASVHYPVIAGGIGTGAPSQPQSSSTTSPSQSSKLSVSNPGLDDGQPSSSQPSAPPLTTSTPSMYPKINPPLAVTPATNTASGWSTLPTAPGPPPMASVADGRGPAGQTVPLALSVQPPADGPDTNATDAAHTDFDDDDGLCVVCMERPCDAGFLHGESVHKCACRECAKAIKNTPKPTCPMCRSPIDHVILKFY